MQASELVALMDSIESFRLEYRTRLTRDSADELERAEIVVRGIITEDEQLRQATATRTCATCGGAIVADRCSCWALLADALQQYSGMDFDGAAEQAAIIWDSDMGSGDKERVWSGEWLDERAWCPYCGTWQREERTNIHHPKCETRRA